MTVRMPVVYQGIPLMPMKASKVKRFVEEKKGKICYDRKLATHYLKLLVPPSGYKTQKITLGVDPGSTFDGFSLVSKTTHHTNFQLTHRYKSKSKNSKLSKSKALRPPKMPMPVYSQLCMIQL